MLTTGDIKADLPGTAAPASLKPLFRGVWRLDRSAILAGTPAGTRVIIDINEGVLQGRGITAHLQGAAADWYLIGPDGTGTLDWRGRVVTDDGSLIYIHGSGRRDPDGKIVGACLFETGADRYRWLNTVQAAYRACVVGEGTPDALYHDEYLQLV